MLDSWIFPAIPPDPVHLSRGEQFEFIVVLADPTEFDEDRARSIVESFREDNPTLVSGRRAWMCDGRWSFDVTVRRETIDAVLVSIYLFDEER